MWRAGPKTPWLSPAPSRAVTLFLIQLAQSLSLGLSPSSGKGVPALLPVLGYCTDPVRNPQSKSIEKRAKINKQYSSESRSFRRMNHLPEGPAESTTCSNSSSWTEGVGKGKKLLSLKPIGTDFF